MSRGWNEIHTDLTRAQAELSRLENVDWAAVRARMGASAAPLPNETLEDTADRLEEEAEAITYELQHQDIKGVGDFLDKGAQIREAKARATQARDRAGLKSVQRGIDWVFGTNTAAFSPWDKEVPAVGDE